MNLHVLLLPLHSSGLWSGLNVYNVFQFLVALRNHTESLCTEIKFLLCIKILGKYA